MIAETLKRDIDRLASQRCITELSYQSASEACKELAARFLGDSPSRWWWDSLKSDPVIVPYNDEEVFDLLQRILPSSEILFIPTDDEEGQWPVYTGSVSAVINMVMELQFFEYFIADKGYNWVVFDTHHNSLVIAGDLPFKENVGHCS